MGGSSTKCFGWRFILLQPWRWLHRKFWKRLIWKVQNKIFYGRCFSWVSPAFRWNFWVYSKVSELTYQWWIYHTFWLVKSKQNESNWKYDPANGYWRGEYGVLVYEDSTTLASFSAMIIEFHNLQKLFERDFLKMVSAVFEKIYKNFSICHVHLNNCCGIASLDGIEIPRVIEVSFVRNDLIDKFSSKTPISLPHNLDSKNIDKNEDIVMPEMWWKSE